MIKTIIARLKFKLELAEYLDTQKLLIEEEEQMRALNELRQEMTEEQQKSIKKHD